MNQRSYSKTAIAAVLTVMLYSRPAILGRERITGMETIRRPHTDGPYVRAIFPEQEAAERLESGFWVDHPNKLPALDAAIAEAAEKEAKKDKQEADDEEAARLKAQQDAEAQNKAPESTATASEQEAAPKAAEGEKEPEKASEAQESTQSEAAAEQPKADAPKDGEKVDGAKVDTKAKVKK